MRKIVIRVITIAAGLMALTISTVLAQSFFGNSGSNQTAPAPANNQLSQQSFQDIVNKKAQENQSLMQQQLNQQLGHNPLSTTPATPPPSTTENAGATPTTTQPAQNPTETATAPTTPESGMPNEQAPAISNESPPAPTAAPLAPAPVQPQVYTGFAPPPPMQNKSVVNPGNKTANPSTGNSNGWNINY